MDLGMLLQRQTGLHVRTCYGPGRIRPPFREEDERVLVQGEDFAALIPAKEIYDSNPGLLERIVERDMR